MASSVVMHELQRATRPLHQELEGRLGLLDPDLSLARYKSILLGMRAIYRRLEARRLTYVHQMVPEVMQWPKRSHVSRLARDLLQLEDVVPAGSYAEPPDIALSGVWAHWGAAYVTEGASLGGQLLSRKLGPRLHLTREGGLAFFCGYGAETGRYWKTFCRTLTAEVYRADSPERALSGAALGAAATFRLFLETFGDAAHGSASQHPL